MTMRPAPIAARLAGDRPDHRRQAGTAISQDRDALIERCRTIGSAPDHRSEVDAHCARQEQVISTAPSEVEADLSVLIKANDCRIHPIGFHRALDPYQ